MDEASRDNAGKPEWDLVDFEALEPMVRVLEFGAKKYAKDNWKKGGKLSTSAMIMASLLRHTYAILKGELRDKESGELHIGHIMCNAMFWARLHGMVPKEDKGVILDRYYPSERTVFRRAILNAMEEYKNQ